MLQRLRSLAIEHGFGPPPEAERTDGDTGARRIAACSAISFVGLLLVVPNALALSSRSFGVLGDLMALLGIAVSAALIAVGALLYRSGFGTTNALRISVWTSLGIVVLGGVVATHATFGSVGRGLSGLFLTGNLLAIGAGAHVIIGVVDARRVRAEQLAAERRRLAVLNRVIRHNLRNEATVLQGHAQQLAENVDDEDLRNSASAVQRSAEVIGGLSSKAKLINQVADRSLVDRREHTLRDVVERAVESVHEDDPGAPIDVDVPTATVRADPALGEAITELLRNAIEHGGDEPNVHVRATRADGAIWLEIHDDGPGIPEQERAVVMGEQEITPLVHGSGLGLWLAREVATASGGDLDIWRREDGTTVRMRLPVVETSQ